MAEKLTKLDWTGLKACAEACEPGVNYGMHHAWKPATMARLAFMGLVAKRAGLRTKYTGKSFTGWSMTEAGRAKLQESTDVS